MKQSELMNFFSKKRKLEDITNHSESLNVDSEPILKKLDTSDKRESDADSIVRIDIKYKSFQSPQKSEDEDALSTQANAQSSNYNSDSDSATCNNNENVGNLDKVESDIEGSDHDNENKFGDYEVNETETNNTEKKTKKERFLDDYVNNEKSIYISWLVYQAVEDALFCKLCLRAKMTTHNAWGNPEEGCKTFKKDVCERHLIRDSHKKAIKYCKEVKENEMKITKFINPNQVSINQHVNTEYKNLFLNVYWGSKEEIPLLTITSLNDFTKQFLKVSMPEYHLSRKSATKISYSIASFQKNILLEDIKQSSHIGILIDESTDVSHKSILLLYIRFYSNKKHQICEYFLKLFELEQANAQYIYNTVKDYLVKEGIFQKVKFLCTDGAPAMSSLKEGVAGKFKQDLPVLISFKCVCHQENLALKHTYKKFEQLGRFNRKLVNIISYFQNSPKKVRILEEIQYELEFDSVLKLIKAKEIRWNSFFYATNRIRQLYPALIKTLDEIKRQSILKEDKKEAQEIKNLLLDFNFVYLLNWLSDFLNPICHLNKQLQTSNYQIIYLKQQIEQTINTLKSDYDIQKPNIYNSNNFDHEATVDEVLKYHLGFNGFYLSLFLSRCEFIDNTTVNYECMEYEKETQIVRLEYTKIEAIELKVLINDSTKYLIQELEQIIPDSENLLSNFEIFNFDILKALKEEDISNYGNEKLKKLLDYYFSSLNLVDKELAISEWTKVKRKIIQEFNNPLFDDPISYLLKNPYFDNGFDCIKELIKIFCALPSSNAEVERGFSAMKRIKTELRNRLLSETLDTLMTISLLGEPIEKFNPEIYINYWMKLNNLRNLPSNIKK